MSDQPRLGFVVDRWLGNDAQKMVLGGCEENSPAERAGLTAGDCIVAIDGKPPLDFVRSAWWPRPHPDEPITVALTRADVPMTVCLRLGVGEEAHEDPVPVINPDNCVVGHGPQFDPSAHLPRVPELEKMTGIRALGRPVLAGPPDHRAMSAVLQRDRARREDVQAFLHRRWRLSDPQEVENASHRISRFDEVLAYIDARERSHDNFIFDYDPTREDNP